MLESLLTGVSQGLIWAVLALGVFISYRLLDFADLSCEGCFTCGASVCAVCLWAGIPSVVALLAACGAGALVGTVTGLLHTKLKIPPILAGILTMTSLYSVNIHIMSAASGVEGTANLSLQAYRSGTLYAQLNGVLGLGRRNTAILLGVLIAAGVIFLLYWFFGTELGCAIRATGDNEKMCRAQGIHTDRTKIIGLALSNALIALSGALLCQYQTAVDINMGVGSIVIGLASIIIGETLFRRAKGFLFRLCGIVFGAVLYRVVVSLVIFSGMPSVDLKLLTAAVVVCALGVPTLFAHLPKKRIQKKGESHATTND